MIMQVIVVLYHINIYYSEWKIAIDLSNHFMIDIVDCGFSQSDSIQNKT